MSRSSSAPALSIVVPAPRDTAALEATLVSVLENRPADCEIVVPLGFAYDDPWGVAGEVRLVPAPPGSGLASCANVGIAASAAPVVHLLAAGWLATPGWTDQPRELLGDADVKAVVPAAVAAAGADAIVAAGVRVTSGGRRTVVVPRRRVAAARVRPAAPLLEAGFWRADVLEAAGPGFAASCGDWLADADMATALACLPGRVAYAPESRVVCGPQRRRPRAFTAGLQSERLFWRSLARGGAPVAVVAHAIEVLRDIVTSAPLGTVPMLVGRIVALMQFGDSLARIARLRAARAAAASASPTLRIDGPHAGLARPSRMPSDAQPLRRSA
ncbi:MAG: glycosyltransferase family 2 protein [Planctomycetaceae bacterium]